MSVAAVFMARPRPLTAIGRLAAPVDIDGPRVRLGVTWAVVSVGAVLAGAVPLALVFAVLAVPASAHSCQSWRRTRRKPSRPVAVVGAVLLVLGGLWGPGGVLIALLFVATLLALGRRSAKGPLAGDTALTAAIALSVGAAGASVVVLRTTIDPSVALAVILMAHAYDSGAFVVGSGAPNKWEGPLAGMAAVAAMGLFSAAVFTPPFSPLTAAKLAAVVAVTAPIGATVASAVLRRPNAKAPGLRRLDAWLVAGPASVLVSRLLLLG